MHCPCVCLFQFLLFLILHLAEMQNFIELPVSNTKIFFQIVHFVNRDSLSLANDYLSLGFIPEGVDIHLVSNALQASFADRTGESQDFQVCSCFILLLGSIVCWVIALRVYLVLDILVVSLHNPKQSLEQFSHASRCFGGN